MKLYVLNWLGRTNYFVRTNHYKCHTFGFISEALRFQTEDDALDYIQTILGDGDWYESDIFVMKIHPLNFKSV